MLYVVSRVYKTLFILIAIGLVIVYALTVIYYTNELRERENEISILKQRISELETIRTNLAYRLSDLSKDYDELNKTVSYLEKLNNELEKNISRLNWLISSLNYEKESLTREITFLRKIVELRENKTLTRDMNITIEPRRNKTFVYKISYSGYLYVLIDTVESNIVLKIAIHGNYTKLLYQYEYLVNIGPDASIIILPVLPGEVELIIINTMTKTITIEKIEVINVY